MSSRQEEKERRRRERLEREAAEARAHARKKRLGMAGGGVLAAAALAAVVVAVVSGAGGKDGNGSDASPAAKGVPIPAQRINDVKAAAAAAGCQLRTFPVEGRNHTEEQVAYRTNPPTSGDHHPQPASDGVYDPGTTPDTGMLVHALEHGRVLVQYRPGLDARRRGQLETLYNEKGGGKPGGYNTLLFQNTTNMPFQVAATSWTQMLGCPTFTDKTFDALRTFRNTYRDKAPELVQAPE